MGRFVDGTDTDDLSRARRPRRRFVPGSSFSGERPIATRAPLIPSLTPARRRARPTHARHPTENPFWCYSMCVDTHA